MYRETPVEDIWSRMRRIDETILLNKIFRDVCMVRLANVIIINNVRYIWKKTIVILNITMTESDKNNYILQNKT